jgi:chemotaxis protein methyltransferase CheR
MTEADFAFLRDFLLRRSGLSLSVDKRYLVESRLAAVCRQHAVSDIGQLVQKVRAGQAELATAVVEAMTTNETLFFRDALPFQHFRNVMMPALMKARAGSQSRTIRIWCAAASSGQEPYSLAMQLEDMADEIRGWTIEILATDISGEILAKARGGVYSQFEVQRGLPIHNLMKHFTQEGDRWRISDRIRRRVVFKQHNLLEPLAANSGLFDIVFCRNVLIYFDVPTKAKVMEMLARHVAPDGFLAVGAAETMLGICDAFTVDREHRGIYRPAAHRQPVRPSAAREKPSPRLSMAADPAQGRASPFRVIDNPARPR